MVCVYFYVSLCVRLCVGGAQPQQETLQRKWQIPAVGLCDQGGSSARLSAEGPTLTAEGKHSSEVAETLLFSSKWCLSLLLDYSVSKHLPLHHNKTLQQLLEPTASLWLLPL